MAFEARPRVTGIVLAAGRSERFGRSKALLVVDGRPMVRRVVDAMGAGGCDPIIVVVGPDDSGVRAALADAPVRVVRNVDAVRGIGTSVAAGARACPADVDAIAIAVADQPWLSADLVQRLIDVWRQGCSRIVRPVAGHVIGHPVVFDGSLLGELCAVDDQRGGSALIAAHPDEVAYVAIDDARTLADIDTPGGVEALTADETGTDVYSTQDVEPTAAGKNGPDVYSPHNVEPTAAGKNGPDADAPQDVYAAADGETRPDADAPQDVDATADGKTGPDITSAGRGFGCAC